MAAPTFSDKLEPHFLLLTSRLLLVPTVIAIDHKPYRDFYSHIHSLPIFCEMGFGPHFHAKIRSDAQIHEMIHQANQKDWAGKGLGDFGVGMSSEVISGGELGRPIGTESTLRLVEGEAFTDLTSKASFWESIKWVGYAGVRDASTRMPLRTADDPPLPRWQEMVEVRYGVGPSHWGLGIATEAGRAVAQWAVSERGVRRFVAETEKLNTRSGEILRKLGFAEKAGNEYWKDPDEVEWEKNADCR